jgi:hypothetical protein
MLNGRNSRERLGARGKLGDAGLAKEKRSSRLGRSNGYRSTKVSSKVKAGAKKIAGIETRSGCTTVKAHMHMLDVSISTRVITEGKGRDN